MRLIGHVKNEKQAFLFYSFLLGEGIHCTYEIDKDQQKNVVLLWVYEEDQIERAEAYLEEFKNNPQDPKFARVEFPEAPPVPPDHLAQPKKTEEEEKRSWKQHPRKIKRHPLTSLVIMVCVFLYMLTVMQEAQMAQADGELSLTLGFVPIAQKLMFDYPASQQKIDQILEEHSLKDDKTIPPAIQKEIAAAQNIPTWQGVIPQLIYKLKKMVPPTAIDGPMFEKIREGEYWRLFTPVLLHGSILHILFNMAWVWILLPPIEARLPKWKILFLLLLLGVLPNLAQYFISGPYFLGFSGIVVGLVGFIWVRQKIAPWEGYPLQKVVVVFVIVYIAALFGLEIFSLIQNVVSKQSLSANIANTAHIVGGLIGALLGTLPFFSRGAK